MATAAPSLFGTLTPAQVLDMGFSRRRGVKLMSGFEWFLLVVVVILVPLVVAVMITLWTLEQARKRNRKNREAADPAAGPVKRRATRDTTAGNVVAASAVDQTVDGMMTEAAMADDAIASPGDVEDLSGGESAPLPDDDWQRSSSSIAEAAESEITTGPGGDASAADGSDPGRDSSTY